MQIRNGVLVRVRVRTRGRMNVRVILNVGEGSGRGEGNEVNEVKNEGVNEGDDGKIRVQTEYIFCHLGARVLTSHRERVTSIFG